MNTRSRNHLQDSKVYGHASGNRIPALGASSVGKASHALLQAPGTKSGAAVAGIYVQSHYGVQVLDEDGNDVTPVSLLAPSKGHGPMKGHGGGIASATEVSIASMTKETVADVLNNLESMTMGSWNASGFGRSNMSFAGSSRASVTSSPIEKDDEMNSISGMDSDEDKDDVVIDYERKGSANSDGPSAALSEEELNQLMHIHLEETDTIWILDLPAVAVCTDFTEEAAMVRSANAKYQELVASRANNENFTDRGMQTFNNFLKSKDVQASGPAFTAVESQVNQWSLYDSYYTSENRLTSSDQSESSDKDLDVDLMPLEAVGENSLGMPLSYTGNGIADSMIIPQTQQPINSGPIELTSGSMMASRSVYLNDDNASEANFSVFGGGQADLGTNIDYAAFQEKEVVGLQSLNIESLRNSLLVMERAVVGNSYEKKHLLYRNIQEEDMTARNLSASDESEESEPTNTADMGEEASNEGGRDNNGELGIGEDDEADQPEENGEDDLIQPDTSDGEEKEGDFVGTSIPTLNALWSYRCELTRGRSVTFMAWNKQNEDILAVSYGEHKINNASSPGLLLCWSPKNPEWPERIYKISSPVTAIDFSRSNPNLLAAGLMDGRIFIYDVRQKDNKPVLDNSDLAGKHRDPVWELKWVDRERVIGDDQSRGETLVSISTDGRVCQWLIRKGLEYTDLMTLKRVPRQQEMKGGFGSQGSGSGSGAGTTGGVVSKTSAFIARQAGGLCFDFNPNDSNIYLVGTEDGHIHRCSCSYNEQYLLTQFGHTGAIYKVKWSPFLPAYLSCSADWTLRLWADNEEEAVFKFQSGKDAIMDVAWSPTNSTVFGCVSNDGRMEIWDLQFSVLDPAILHTVLDRRLTSIIFASQSPNVLIGDDNGAVSVFNLKGGSIGKSSKLANVDEQASALAKVMSNKNLTVQTDQKNSKFATDA